MKRRHFLWYSLLSLASCKAITNPLNRTNSTGLKLEKLRLTVTDLKSLKELERYYGSFRTSLEQILEKPIEFVPVENFMAAAPALQLDRVDLVIAGPSEYVVLKARTNAIPAIAITRPNYHSILCVRSDSPIASVEELKGKTIAMWEIGSTSGHLGPTKLLMDANLNPQSDVTIRMLKRQGLEALNEGEVDAWGGTFLRYKSFLESQGLSESDFRILVQSLPLPNDLLMVNSLLPADFIESIGSRVLEHQDEILKSLLLADDRKYEGASLVAANDSDYDLIRDVYRALGQEELIQ